MRTAVLWTRSPQGVGLTGTRVVIGRGQRPARSRDLGRRDIGHKAEPGDAGMRSRYGVLDIGQAEPSPEVQTRGLPRSPTDD